MKENGREARKNAEAKYSHNGSFTFANFARDFALS
jgi:hypothetical protein